MNSPSSCVASPLTSANPTRNLVLLLMNVLCVAAAEVFLSRGSKATTDVSVFGIAAIQSIPTMIGIVFHVAGFIFWMLALRTVPLGLAYNFVCANQVLVPVSAWLFLHEHISPLKWFGISLVVVGIVLLVPLIVQTEVQLDMEPAAVDTQVEPEAVTAG